MGNLVFSGLVACSSISFLPFASTANLSAESEKHDPLVSFSNEHTLLFLCAFVTFLDDGDESLGDGWNV